MIRPKVNRQQLARAFASGSVQVETPQRPYELPLSNKSSFQAAPPAASRDARPISLCLRIFAMILLGAMGKRVQQFLTFRRIHWTWDDPTKWEGEPTLTGALNSATSTVTCSRMINLSTVNVTLVLLSIGILDDVCGLVWRNVGVSKALRHACVLYVAAVHAGILDIYTLTVACAAAACWPSVEFDSRCLVVAWMLAWIFPVMELVGGSLANTDQYALCFVVFEWILLMIDAAFMGEAGSRMSIVRDVVIEYVLVVWLLGPGKAYRTVSAGECI